MYLFLYIHYEKDLICFGLIRKTVNYLTADIAVRFTAIVVFHARAFVGLKNDTSFTAVNVFRIGVYRITCLLLAPFLHLHRRISKKNL